jgi:hypothetical protein
MGFRSKIKGRLKGVLGKQVAKPVSPPSPSKFNSSITEDTGAGNLRGEKDDVPWYLKFEDSDGWESTDVTLDQDKDEDES